VGSFRHLVAAAAGMLVLTGCSPLMRPEARFNEHQEDA